MGHRSFEQEFSSMSYLKHRWENKRWSNGKRGEAFSSGCAGFLPSFLPLFTRREWPPPPRGFKPRFRFHARFLHEDLRPTCLSARWRSLPVIERFGLMGFHFHFPESIIHPCSLYVYHVYHRRKKRSMIRRKSIISNEDLSFQSFQLLPREGN